jgi:hypothetical protein
MDEAISVSLQGQDELGGHTSILYLARGNVKFHVQAPPRPTGCTLVEIRYKWNKSGRFFGDVVACEKCKMDIGDNSNWVRSPRGSIVFTHSLQLAASQSACRSHFLCAVCEIRLSLLEHVPSALSRKNPRPVETQCLGPYRFLQWGLA